MKPLYITYNMLRRLDACEERESFKTHFGNGRVLVTVTTAVANASWVNWPWLSERMLEEEAYVALRYRVNAEFKGETCFCNECDPDGGKLRLQAQWFAEALLAQGGFAKHG